MHLVNVFLNIGKREDKINGICICFGADGKIFFLSDAGFLCTLQGYFCHHEANNYKQLIYPGVTQILLN
jgi:hypothetical protein